EIPELNVERRVNDSGTIDLPLIGAVPVAGKTAAEAQQQGEQILRGKDVNPAKDSAVVQEVAHKPVSVGGSVAQPGSLSISGNWYLLQAISAAGGIDASAGRKIFVLRRSDNGLTDVLEIRRDDLLQGSTVTWNIPIFAGDVVNIPSRTIVKV